MSNMISKFRISDGKDFSLKNFDAGYAVRRVRQFVDVGGLDGFREAWPAGSGVIFVRRREQRLARYDIDINSRFLGLQIRAGSRPLGIALLGDPVLLRR